MSTIGFPLLLIPLAICNIILFLMPGVSFSAPLITLTLMSGAAWPVTLSDALLTLGIFLLLLEVMKAGRVGAKYLTDHLLSLIVFGGAAAEFVLLPQFGTSTFFLLSMLALVDFLAGVALRVRRPRRAVVAPPASVAVPERIEPVPAAAPKPVPASASPSAASVPPAASVAEAVLLDRTEPKTESKIEPRTEPQPVPPAVVAHDASPEIQSPDLQPGNGAHRPPDVPPTR